MTTDEKIALIAMVTKISFEYLQNAPKEEIDRLYEEKCNG